MTRGEVLAMAYKAGTTFITEVGVASATPEWLEQFARLVAEAEREACAKEADRQVDLWYGLFPRRAASECAKAIRARGSK